ncbi:centromere protein M isoform X2 [Hyperolius riggenbachi]|uniref:centromere protein M isoform X2 n=1 Tax=Hyperolius riggenbachi TaxID=752182 RepID=UPI0035A34A90
MADLRPFDKMPLPNTSSVLFVGLEESHRELLASAMLKEPKTFDVKIHMTQSLPLPFEREHLRPRFDLVVFFINLHCQLSLDIVISSIKQLDAYYFLGKVCFLATRGRNGQVHHSMVDVRTVKELADKHLSIFIQTELDQCPEQEGGRSQYSAQDLPNEDDVIYTAERLLSILKICAGLVPAMSSLRMSSVLKHF